MPELVESLIVLPPLRFSTDGARRRVAPFIRSLSDIMTQSDSEIVRWNLDGDKICIVDPDRFEATILPRFFHQIKLASFRRQLNYYGFKRVFGSDYETYFNPYFSRFKPTDMNNIVKGRTDAEAVVLDHPIYPEVLKINRQHAPQPSISLRHDFENLTTT